MKREQIENQGSENRKGAGVENDGAFLSYTERCRKLSDKHWLVVSKWIGLEGTWRIATQRSEELLTRYPPLLVAAAKEQNKWLSVEKESAIAVQAGADAIREVRYGGIFGALWELSRELGRGFCVDLKRIPVRQETIEVCEWFHLNPYELLSGGMLLMAAADVGTLSESLKEAEIPFSVIGSTNGSNDRIVKNGENVRYLGPVASDEIFKIIK